ncbi:hypothetical protein EMIT0196P_10157 [Pseudomonas chlororaphis]
MPRSVWCLQTHSIVIVSSFGKLCPDVKRLAGGLSCLAAAWRFCEVGQNAIIALVRGWLLCVICAEALCSGAHKLLLGAGSRPSTGRRTSSLGKNTQGCPPAKDLLACCDCIELLL